MSPLHFPFFVKWSIFNNLAQHTTLHDNPANGKGATHPLTPIQAHTNSLAEAFIDWTTGQREDTKMGGETCQNHFLDRLNKPPSIR